METLTLAVALAQLQASLIGFQIANASIVPPQAQRPQEAEVVVRQYADLFGVDQEIAVAVAKCESSLNPGAIGDGGKSRGLWQIHKPSHPEISDEEAHDVEKSTAWAMPRLKETPRIWTCYRNLFGA